VRWRRRTDAQIDAQSATRAGRPRLDVPVYLDAGVALSLSASLGRGLVMESSVERATADKTDSTVGASAGVPHVASIKSQLGGSQSVAVTESEVRKQTQESIFNNVRGLLDEAELLRTPEAWETFEWRIGDFVDLRSERIVVPLVSILSRVHVMADAFAFATTELSPDALERRVPQLLDQIREATAADSELSPVQDNPTVDAVIALLREIGEIARALSGVINRLEEEADASGLVDVVMLQGWNQMPQVVVVASLDRDYVDRKLLRRLGQSTFGVLGKVIRTPERSTAFNAFRNSIFGTTNQFPVLLSRLTQRLQELPSLLGDAVLIPDRDDPVLNFVGSASALADMNPVWAYPSVELFPIAIYA
jgi:hypothetical protein